MLPMQSDELLPFGAERFPAQLTAFDGTLPRRTPAQCLRQLVFEVMQALLISCGNGGHGVLGETLLRSEFLDAPQRRVRGGAASRTLVPAVSLGRTDPQPADEPRQG